MSFKEIANWLPPEAWSTYIVGLIAIAVGLWQWRRSFRLNKNAGFFDVLSDDVDEAVKLVNSITSSTQTIIVNLAEAANKVAPDYTNSSKEQQMEELRRREEDLKNLASGHLETLKSIYDGYEKVIRLIQKVEKSTVVGDLSKATARQLFYIATDQHNLVTASNKVLQSFRVTPPLNELPNITADTFNAFRDLVEIINARNDEIRSFLEDLEVVLHNDLVKGIFGKAQFSKIPVKHLTPKGVVDSRSNESLL